MKRTLIPLAVAALTLTACGNNAQDTTATTPPSTVETVAVPEAYAFTDTAQVVDSLGETLASISDIETTTEGCEPGQQMLIATVETNVDSPEILWSSDISYTTTDGMKLTNRDTSDSHFACENDTPSEFNNMLAGDKRRAGITLSIPEDAETIVYTPSTLPGAQPIKWTLP